MFHLKYVYNFKAELQVDAIHKNKIRILIRIQRVNQKLEFP